MSSGAAIKTRGGPREDATTFLGASDDTRISIDCGGARGVDDEVLQHDGGGTVVIGQCIVEEGLRQALPLVRQLQRPLRATRGQCGVDGQGPVSERYRGNVGGDEPTHLDTGPDPELCRNRRREVLYISQ